MQIKYDNKVVGKTLHYSYREGTFEPARRLGGSDYAEPFNLLKIWDLVRTFAIKRFKLTSRLY